MTTLTAPPNPARARDYFNAKMEFTTGPAELKRAIDGGEVFVVDVRAAEDYARGHIPGAINYPKDMWDQPVKLPHDRAVVLYCYSQVCHLAAEVAVRLASAGYPVKELEGGFAGWQQQELPVEGAAGTFPESAGEAVTRSPRQENL